MFWRAIFFIAFTFCVLLTCSIPCFAQGYYDFKPLNTYGRDDSDLIDLLRDQTAEEIARTNSPKRNEVNKLYEAIGKRIRMLVVRNQLIRNDSLQRFIDTIGKKLVTSNNLKIGYKTLLIQNSPSINGLAIAEGTIILNIRLLGRIENESQLAFVLAHEIAHLELQHGRKKITEAVEGNVLKEEIKNLRDLSGNDASADNMESLRKIWYQQSSNNRERELQADSMAVELMENAGYSSYEAIPMLDILGESKKSRIDLDFMIQLDIAAYPLKDEWFRKRPAIFSRSAESVFISSDSVASHPDLELRKQILKEKVIRISSGINRQPSALVNKIIRVSAFQSIQSAYQKEQFDLCLYLALQLRERFPNNPYLTSMIARLFAELYERRDLDYDFYLALSKYTSGYNEELRAVNEFLHNVKREELGEIAFYFLSSKENFNVGYEYHYYLLWRICSMTDRTTERKKIKKEYETLFEDGKYAGKMILYSPYKTKLKNLKHQLRN